MARFQFVSRMIGTTVLTSAVLLAVLGAESLVAADDAWSSPPAKPGGKIVIKTVMTEDEDEQPRAAGKAAGEALKKAMAGVPLEAVVVSECFEDREYKAELIKGLCSVVPPEIVLGGATYGSFTQRGSSDFDSVSLLGIGGEGVSVAAALVTDMGTSKLVFEEHQQEIQKRLRAAGAKLTKKLRRTDQDRLLILIPDAHSPKNQFIVEGAQRVVGPQFPITGGCVNKNAGQTFVYFRGRFYEDSAVALMLSGRFKVSLAGRQAQENDKVISTAREAAAEAAANLKARPIA
ncbi:MAG: FIST N-terminal domain-containing protein, partial [Planctomycetota bacterium]